MKTKKRYIVLYQNIEKIILNIAFFFYFRANPPMCSSCMTAKPTTGARVHSTPGIKLQKRDNRIWDCQARFRPFRNMSHKVDIRAAGRPRDMGVKGQICKVRMNLWSHRFPKLATQKFEGFPPWNFWSWISLDIGWFDQIFLHI